jgi:RNA polymerase sigma-70 factor (ECF subfamily)
VSALPSIAPSAGRPNEADAAADLYARNADRIFGYCLGLLRNREEAEDAVQTTFLNAYRGLRRGIRPEFEAAWLFKIAQNVCRTRQSNAWRRGRIETVRDLDALQDAVAAPEHDAGQATALAEALQDLPERYRTVILLREWQGLSYREIASATGDSEAAVEMLVFRARRALAERLERSDVRSGALSLSSVTSLLKSLFGGAGVKALATGLAVTATAIAVAAVPGDQGATTPHRSPLSPSSLPSVSPTQTGVPATHGRTRQDNSPAAVVPPPGGAVGSSERPSRPTTPGTPYGGNTPQDAPAVAPSSHAPPASSSPGTNVPVPDASVPSVTVPSVTVPGTSISTPSVTTPSVDVPPTPPLPLNTSDLPVSPPDVHLP